MIDAFEGILLKPGSRVEHGALWPNAGFPDTPLLIEFAGSDRTGSGHNRSKQIHILWRFDLKKTEWVEIARTLSLGSDWIPHLVAIALKELGGPPPPDATEAVKASSRFLSGLDSELRALGEGEQGMVLNLVYEQVAARLIKVGQEIPDNRVEIQLRLPL